MGKRNKLFLVIILLLSMSCSVAQNTGYMGKRTIINFNAELSPAWKRPNFSDNPNFQYRWFSFNYTLSPGIEIIAGKRITTGIVYHYFKTKYNIPNISQTDDIVFINIYDTTPLSITPKLIAHGFGIFYKQYMRFADGRAPIGPYIRLQFDGFFYKCPVSHDDLAFFMNDKLFAMKFEIGNDFLFFDRLRLSAGFSLGVPFGGFKGLGLDNDWLSGEDTYNKPINEYARSRILGLYVMAFTVNIGFLAF